MSATDRASFTAALRGGTPQIGMWVASGSPLVAEICAGSGIDWLLIDSEHAPNDVRSLLPQLQACAAYDVQVVVRPPVGDTVVIKQFLDIGAQNLLIPMVESADQARALVRATRYPPAGVRGVGSALARASRWSRISEYLPTADDEICLTVQIESLRGLDALEEIVSVDGIDGVFIGPADLAASMGHLGRPDHPAVVAAVDDAVKTISALGKPAGVNAFQESRARELIILGARFILVGADVVLLARGSEQLAARYR
ncbi:aldolase/citrate lyase family protein [Streptomyces sp. NPDC051572]|uniref:aldolase/citrate lyase family protein n=1 Tax=unclassified Streptomyces TaxID=2593676 RepID=UPI00344B0227